jgi:hypothetical protein
MPLKLVHFCNSLPSGILRFCVDRLQQIYLEVFQAVFANEGVKELEI